MENIKYFKEIILTGFIFQIFMEVFSSIPSNLTDYIDKIELYKLYIKYYIIKKIDKLNKEQKKYIKESFVKKNSDSFLDDRLLEVAGYIASKMHTSSTHRIKNDDPLFNMLGYRASEPIKIQRIWFILKLLPFKIESNESFTSKYDFKQEVAVVFIHDTIKNYFLLQEIKK